MDYLRSRVPRQVSILILLDNALKGGRPKGLSKESKEFQS